MNKLKWFFGEFFVVVSGVLVAFLLNGWWMNIQEHRKERDYLKQIHSDIQSTIVQVEEAKKEQREIVYAVAQLLKNSYSITPVHDSLLIRHTLQSMSFSPSAQLSAALSSLVSTGDLQLIGNDSLRTALGELVSGLADYTSTNNEMAYSWLIPAFERFASVVNLADLRFEVLSEERWLKAAEDSLSGVPFPQDTEIGEPLDLRSLIRDPEFKNVMMLLYVAQSNLYRLHYRFLEDLKETRTHLEHEMLRRDVDF